MPILIVEFKLNQFQTEITSSGFYLGMAVGSLISSFLPDRIGRKRSLIVLGYCNAISCCLTSLATQQY